MRFWSVMLLLVLGAIVFFAIAVRACPPTYHAVKKVEVVKEIVVTPVAVFIPTFSVGYTPYATPAPPAPAGPSNADVLRALQQLGQRLDGLEKARPGVSPPKVTPPASDPAGPQSAVPRAAPGSALAVYTAKCAACHQAGNENKGGSFVLLDAAGQRVQLNDRQRAKVMQTVYAGKMPPKSNDLGIPALTDEEAGLLMGDMKE